MNSEPVNTCYFKLVVNIYYRFYTHKISLEDCLALVVYMVLLIKVYIVSRNFAFVYDILIPYRI